MTTHGTSSFSNPSTPDEAHKIQVRSYYHSRGEMGRQLAEKLMILEGADVAVLALSSGGAVMAVEIAKRLDAPLGLLMLRDIYLPDKRTIVGVINSFGHFTRDVAISGPQMEDFEMEYRNALARSKAQAVTELHAFGQYGQLRPGFFRDKIAVLVHDVTTSGTVFRAGSDFLRASRVDAAVFVSGVARYEAQYYMQEHSDAYVIGHLTDKQLPPSHYFADQAQIEHNPIVKVLKESVMARF